MSGSHAAFEDQILAGTIFSHHAQALGAAPAIRDAAGWISFQDLGSNANRLARRLRQAGLKSGSSVALIMSNRREFAETLLACLQSGLRLTPVNFRMGGDFVDYVVNNCDAEAVISERDLEGLLSRETLGRVAVRLCVDAQSGEWTDYREALDACSDKVLPDPVHGKLMLYTSGTSGTPKGVYRERARTYGKCATPDSEPHLVHLLAGPAFHSAPLWFDLVLPLMRGRRVVMLPRFDAPTVLTTIEAERITHAHMSPIMFERLLALPLPDRLATDVSSLQQVMHGGAPTEPSTKRRMIDWFGPILTEYYAATEISAGILISSEEWLERPGSVGRVPEGGETTILDDVGQPCPVGRVGEIHFKVPPAEDAISYYRDQEETRAVFGGATFTLRDYGYVDDEGYLFLRGRAADKIISGGVNIRPFGVESVLREHPLVADVCAVGIPDREWGEVVAAVVVLANDKSTMSRETARAALRAHCAERLTSIMRPRVVSFVEDLPRTESGKLLRRRVRENLLVESDVAPI